MREASEKEGKQALVHQNCSSNQTLQKPFSKEKAQPRKKKDGIFLATALHEMCKQTCLVYQLLGKTNWYGKATDTWIFDVWVYLISPNPIFSFPFLSILMMKNKKSIFRCISLRLMVGLVQLFIYFQLQCAPAQHFDPIHSFSCAYFINLGHFQKHNNSNEKVVILHKRISNQFSNEISSMLEKTFAAICL